MLLGLAAFEISEVGRRADAILDRRNAAELLLLEKELSVVVDSFLPAAPPYALPYRLALTAERLGQHDVAFERWVAAHRRWPENW
jgi:hypothetical protein